jgi:LysM repeat protein
MDGRRGSRARLLAPISLIAFALAFLLVVAGSDTPDDSDDGRERAGQRDRGSGTDTTTTTTGEGEPRVPGRFYTVKTGDTLAAIAETVGIPVDTLLELNPDLDPQALVSGQKIRLRE